MFYEGKYFLEKVLFSETQVLMTHLPLCMVYYIQESEIVGIVTGYGNVEHIHAAHNAAYILQLANRQNIPVISGATKPLTEEITTYYPEIHGVEGLGPIHVQKIYYLFQYIISAVLLRFL